MEAESLEDNFVDLAMPAPPKFSIGVYDFDFDFNFKINKTDVCKSYDGENSYEIHVAIDAPSDGWACNSFALNMIEVLVNRFGRQEATKMVEDAVGRCADKYKEDCDYFMGHVKDYKEEI